MPGRRAVPSSDPRGTERVTEPLRPGMPWNTTRGIPGISLHSHFSSAPSTASCFHKEVRAGTHIRVWKNLHPPRIASPWNKSVSFPLVIINFLWKLNKLCLLQLGTTASMLIFLTQTYRSSNTDQKLSSKENGVHFEPSLNVCFANAVDTAKTGQDTGHTGHPSAEFTAPGKHCSLQMKLSRGEHPPCHLNTETPLSLHELSQGPAPVEICNFVNNEMALKKHREQNLGNFSTSSLWTKSSSNCDGNNEMTAMKYWIYQTYYQEKNLWIMNLSAFFLRFYFY